MHLSPSIPVCVTWNDLATLSCRLLHLYLALTQCYLGIITLFLLAFIL